MPYKKKVIQTLEMALNVFTPAGSGNKYVRQIGIKVNDSVDTKRISPQNAQSRPHIFQPAPYVYCCSCSLLSIAGIPVLFSFPILKSSSPFTTHYSSFIIHHSSFQSIGCIPWPANSSFVLLKCLHPKKPLEALYGDGCAAFNT
jgi:hypothetical protein